MQILRKRPEKCMNVKKKERKSGSTRLPLVSRSPLQTFSDLIYMPGAHCMSFGTRIYSCYNSLQFVTIYNIKCMYLSIYFLAKNCVNFAFLPQPLDADGSESVNGRKNLS